MGDGIDMGKGLSRVLKRLIPTEGFVKAVLGLLLGKEEAAARLDMMLRDESYSQTLNEVVAVHRALKDDGEETVDTTGKDMGLLRRIAEIPERSLEFQSEVIAKTLRKPGAAIALVKLVRSGGKDPKAWVVVAKAVVESVGETMGKEDDGEKSQEQGVLSERFDPDATKVALFIGRFQPFTLAHANCVAKISQEFQVPVLICAIPATEENTDANHPFWGNIQDEMFERIRKGLNDQFPDSIYNCTYISKGYIGDAVELAKREFQVQPIGWGCGTDRYLIRTPRKRKRKETDSDFVETGYKPQTDAYVASQKNLDDETRDIDPDNFRLLHIERDIVGDGDDPVSKISGTKVREAIKAGDYEAYKNMMPNCLNDREMFEKFREFLTPYMRDEREDFTKEIQFARAGAVSESKRRFFEQLRKDLDGGLMNVMG